MVEPEIVIAKKKKKNIKKITKTNLKIPTV